MPDGSAGALFEFLWPAAFGSGGFPEADRYFVRAENPTNVLGYISRLAVISQDLPQPYLDEPTNFGTGVISFNLSDVRLGMFRRPHRALDFSMFHAAAGRLTMIKTTNGAPSQESQAGVAVELGQSTAFRADLLPIELAAEGAAVTLVGIGNAAGNVGTELGIMRVENTNELLQIRAQFSIAPRFAQIVVLAGGIPVGTNGVPRDMVWVTAGEMRRVVGSDLLARTLASLPGFAVRLDGITTFTTSTGQSFDGDEVRLLASDPAQFESLEVCVISVAGLSSFTITGESSEPFVPPLLSMARSGTNLMFSWPDPNEIFELESASLLELVRGGTPGLFLSDRDEPGKILKQLSFDQFADPFLATRDLPAPARSSATATSGRLAGAFLLSATDVFNFHRR